MLLGLPFVFVTANIDEVRLGNEPPLVHVCRLSQEKTIAAQRMVQHHALIVGLDTIVVDGDRVLGKPASREQAIEYLQTLRGRVHLAITGMTLFNTATGSKVTWYVESPVAMRYYTDTEIRAYVATGDPFDKAGGYALQDPVFSPGSRFEHCFANVMGLPLCHLSLALREFGLSPADDIPQRCQKHIQYQCSVYSHILSGQEINRY